MTRYHAYCLTGRVRLAWNLAPFANRKEDEPVHCPILVLVPAADSSEAESRLRDILGAIQRVGAGQGQRPAAGSLRLVRCRRPVSWPVWRWEPIGQSENCRRTSPRGCVTWWSRAVSGTALTTQHGGQPASCA